MALALPCSLKSAAQWTIATAREYLSFQTHDPWADFWQAAQTLDEAMKTLEGRGVRFHGVADEGKAGKFAHFTDPDGNLLYLAELNWKHVNQGEGQYQHA